MHGSPRELLARRMARELLKEHGVAAHPVDPEWLAAQVGLEVVEMDGFTAHCFGALALVDGGFRILVSRSCPSRGLRRFTIAHELGHACIEDHTDGLSWANGYALSEGHFRGRKNPLEVEADCFASELLIPAAWGRTMVDASRPGVAAVRELAQAFDTSLPCAAVRFAALCGEPVIVVLSDGLTIEWIARSESFDTAPWIRFRKVKGEWAPPGCATRRLAERRGDVLAGAERSGAGYLSEWFEGAPAHLEVAEEAVGLGSYGRVLTLLSCPDLPEPDELYTDGGEEDEPQDWRDAARTYRLG